MLLETFFTIIEQDGANKRFIVELNAEHPIYKGHFPSRPITPGVCSIAIIVECAAQLLHKKLTLSAIRQCRLKDPIEPSLKKIMVHFYTIDFDENNINCKANIESENGDVLLTLTCTLI